MRDRSSVGNTGLVLLLITAGRIVDFFCACIPARMMYSSVTRRGGVWSLRWIQNKSMR